MNKETAINERDCLDPVFLEYGMEVYTYDYIEQLRKENLELKKRGKRSYNLIPQAGFQEEVLSNGADLKIIGGSRGSGKVQPNTTKIVTPFGMRSLGDLKVGDIISDPTTGGMERVIQIFEHPDHDFYEITFDDGTTTMCGLEHLWQIRKTGSISKKRKYNGGGLDSEWRVWTFEMIKNWLDDQTEKGLHFDRGNKKYIAVPLSEPVKFTKAGATMKKKAPFDPYIIGALLGDGCMSEGRAGSVIFTSMDDEIVQQFTNAGFDMSHYTKDTRSKAITYRIPKSQINEHIEKLGLMGCNSETKFIPTCYKMGTVEERFALIQGLMDTDGYTDKGGSGCYFNTISPRLAEDVCFVLRSLGADVSISRGKAGYKNNGVYVACKDCYELHIKIKSPSRLFRLNRKKERCHEFNGGVGMACKRIVSYKHIGKTDGRCITVDSPGALYLCDDFIVTHNTAISLIGALPYADNPDIAMYGFRRYENDVKRGIWKSAKQIFRGFANFADTSFEAKFFNGTGATMKMEHLADLSKIKDRFRGAEMPYIVIEELAEFTKENINVIFDLIGSNRSTTGLPAQFICTCNPVGRSNKLRWFLDWYIDPETDEAIPVRSGKIRYFCRYGEDVMDIAWGNSPEEVYANPNAKKKIQSLTENPDRDYANFITSLSFINGDYADNKILHVTDPKYMNRISSGGSKSVINDIRGVWRDIDDTSSMITADDMHRFFTNTSQTSGTRCGGGDIAFKHDWLVLWALDGMHIIDIEARKGVTAETLPDIIRAFCQRNQIPFENFAFDGDGVGVILKQTEDMDLQKCHPFSNKAAANDKVAYRNRKSECAGILINALQSGTISIEESVLRATFTEKKIPFTIMDKLMEERVVLRWIEDENPRELIKKNTMKDILGHSPDFIEGLLYAIDRVDSSKKKAKVRRGDWSYFM